MNQARAAARSSPVQAAWRAPPQPQTPSAPSLSFLSHTQGAVQPSPSSRNTTPTRVRSCPVPQKKEEKAAQRPLQLRLAARQGARPPTQRHSQSTWGLPAIYRRFHRAPSEVQALCLEEERREEEDSFFKKKIVPVAFPSRRASPGPVGECGAEGWASSCPPQQGPPWSPSRAGAASASGGKAREGGRPLGTARARGRGGPPSSSLSLWGASSRHFPCLPSPGRANPLGLLPHPAFSLVAA